MCNLLVKGQGSSDTASSSSPRFHVSIALNNMGTVVLSPPKHSNTVGPSPNVIV